MGQAFFAVSDDGTAGSWNPAGLHIHEKTMMSFSYGALIPRGTYEYYARRDRTNIFDHGGTVGGINNWTLITPMRIKNHHFVFNFSTTQNFDSYFRFGEKIFEWSDANPDDPSDDQDANAVFERKGSVNSINLGFGTRLYKQLSFGLSANIYYGSVASEEIRSMRIDTVVEFLGDEMITVTTDYSVYDSTSYSGFNLNLGFLYSGDRLRTGLVFRQPFTLRGDSDSTMHIYSYLNDVLLNLVGSPYITETIFVDNMTSKIEMPWMLGFGLAYQASDNLLIAGDVEYRAFKGNVVENLESLELTASGDKVETYSSSNPNWSNVIQGRLGMEYIFNTSIGEVPVRFGLRNENLPHGSIVGYTVEYTGPKSVGGVPSEASNDSTRVFYSFDYNNTMVRGGSISFGTGIHWSQALIDIAYTYTNYEQGIYPDGVLIKSKNIWKNHHINFTFTGYF
jgi:long-subunit fatty acid transport protein